jgi:WD40 repeat protein
VSNAKTGEAVVNPIVPLQPEPARASKSFESAVGAPSISAVMLNGLPTLVTGTGDGLLRWWSIRNGAELGRAVAAHAPGTTVVAAGDIGGRTLVVSGGADGLVRRWDAKTHQEACEPISLSGRQVRTLCVAQVLDRQVIAVGSWSKETETCDISFWDTTTGDAVTQSIDWPIVQSSQKSSQDFSETLSSSGEPVANRGGVSFLQKSGIVYRGPLHGHEIGSAAFTIGNIQGFPVLMSGQLGQGVIFLPWLASDWESAQSLYGIAPNTSIPSDAFSIASQQFANRTVIALGRMTGTVSILLPTDVGWQFGQQLEGHSGPVSAIAVDVSEHHPTLVTGGYDRTVRVWEPDLEAASEPSPKQSSSTIGNLSIASGQLLASSIQGELDSTSITIVDAFSGRTVFDPVVIPHGIAETVSFFMIGDSPILIGATRERAQVVRISLFDARTGRIIAGKQESGADRISNLVAGNAAGRIQIAACRRHSDGLHGEVSIWHCDPHTRDMISIASASSVPSELCVARTVEIITGRISACALASLHGHPVVIVGDDMGVIDVFHANSGALRYRIRDAHSGSVSAVAARVSKRQEIVASGGADGWIRFWRNAEPKPLLELEIGNPIQSILIDAKLRTTIATSRGIVQLDVLLDRETPS